MFSPSGLFSFTFFEYGSRLVQMLGKREAGWRRRTMFARTARKPAAFDNADGPIWIVGEKSFRCHPKKFLGAARPRAPFFRASLKWDCGTWLFTNRHVFLALKRIFSQARKARNCIESERFLLRVKFYRPSSTKSGASYLHAFCSGSFPLPYPKMTWALMWWVLGMFHALSTLFPKSSIK